MLNWVISILLLKGILTEEEAKKLTEELPQHTHPTDFKLAHSLVEHLLKK